MESLTIFKIIFPIGLLLLFIGLYMKYKTVILEKVNTKKYDKKIKNFFDNKSGLTIDQMEDIFKILRKSVPIAITGLVGIFVFISVSKSIKMNIEFIPFNTILYLIIGIVLIIVSISFVFTISKNR